MWSEWLEATLERSSAVVELSETRERLQRVETLMNDDADDEKASAWAARRVSAEDLD
jgi:hypothetical protein